MINFVGLTNFALKHMYPVGVR